MAFGAAALGAFAGLSIYQGEKQAGAQKRALRSQEQAQRDSMAMAAAQQRRAEMDARKANARQPDTSLLLRDEQKAALDGPASTILGGSGATKGRAKLGQTSLLGA